jgi:hypothetical protein
MRNLISTLFSLSLVLFSLSQKLSSATVPDAIDPELKRFEISPLDKENCTHHGDCEDWCKEQGQNDTRYCVCRCEKWITESDFNCANGTTICQVVSHLIYTA